MRGDAFFFFFFFFNKKKQQREKILFPQPTKIVLNPFLFKIFFLLRLITLDFVKEQLIETMPQHLCPGWNTHVGFV